MREQSICYLVVYVHTPADGTDAVLVESPDDLPSLCLAGMESMNCSIMNHTKWELLSSMNASG